MLFRNSSSSLDGNKLVMFELQEATQIDSVECFG